MVEIDRKLRTLNSELKTKMILQVHDELVFEVPEKELNRVTKLIKEIMETAFPPLGSLGC